MPSSQRVTSGLLDDDKVRARLQNLDRENRELRAALRAREVELRECNHRVANSLQIAAALLHMQTGAVTDNSTKDILRRAAERIQAIARFHRHLTTTGTALRLDFSQCLATAAAEISASSDIYCDVQSTPGLLVDGHLAMNLTLIVNELMLNAKKHAYRDKSGGRLEITCLADTDGNLRLSVIDFGPGLPANFRLDGMAGIGMSLIQSIVRQHHGKITTANNHGACFKITVPMVATISQ